MTQTRATQQSSEQAADKTAVRPFQVNVPESELTDLRRRIQATKFPERETSGSAFFGRSSSTMLPDRKNSCRSGLISSAAWYFAAASENTGSASSPVLVAP
jgi:hypothetical protein